MNEKTVESILKDWRFMLLEVDTLNELMHDCFRHKQDLYQTVKANKITGLPHGTDISDPVGNVQEHIDKINKRLEHVSFRLSGINETIDFIMGALSKLEQDERAIIQCMYISQQQYGIKQICKQVHACRNTVYNIRDRAIKKIAGMEG